MCCDDAQKTPVVEASGPAAVGPFSPANVNHRRRARANELTGALTGTRDARWKTKDRKKKKERTTAALAARRARSLPKDTGSGSQARTSSHRRRGQRTGPTSSNAIPQRAAQGPRRSHASRTPDGARATSLAATGLLHVRGRIQLILPAAFQILPTSPCCLGWLANADGGPSRTVQERRATTTRRSRRRISCRPRGL